MRRSFAVAAIVTAILLPTGCDVAGPNDASPWPDSSGHAGRTQVSKDHAQSQLDAAIAEISDLKSVAILQRQHTWLPKRRISFKTSVNWFPAEGSWRSVTKNRPQPAAGRVLPTMQVVVVDQREYVRTAPSAGLSGLWTDVTASVDDPSALANAWMSDLMDVEATGGLSRNEDVSISGHLPNSDAIRLLGMSAAIRKAGLDDDLKRGTGLVTVRLVDGSLTRFTVRGDAIELPARGVPSDLAARLKDAHLVARYSQGSSSKPPDRPAPKLVQRAPAPPLEG